MAAATMTLAFVPYLFGGALLSAAVERWPPRATLVACHVASAVLVAVMVIPGLSVAALLVLLFAVGLCAPVTVFATRPSLLASLGVLFAVGLGFAYSPGLDQRLVDVAPASLRNTSLAVSSAGLMFIQGVGFAVWGVAAEVAPIRIVIPAAAIIGMIAVLALARSDSPATS